MSLAARVLNVLSFNLIQTILSKILSAVQLAILVRILSNADIGAIGLSAGYIAILSFFVILPETIFVRDFIRMQEKINQYITSFFLFGLVRGALLVIVSLPIAYWLYSSQGSLDVAIYFMLTVLSLSLNTLTGPFREAFYSVFRQARISATDLGLSVLSLTLLSMVLLHGTLVTYGWVQLLSAIIAVLVWIHVSKKHLGFTFQFVKGWWDDVYSSLVSFSFWNQLTSTTFRLIYQIDTVILSFFVSLAAIGSYTVALTLGNLFFVFPQFIQKILVLSFSRISEKEDLSFVMGMAVKYTVLFSIAQFLGYLLIQDLLIAFFSPENPTQVKEYAFYLVLGVTIFNMARPWLSLGMAKLNVRTIFLQYILPVTVFALALYFFAASQLGALGVAQANVLVYSLAGIWLIAYCVLNLKLWPRFALFSEQEKKMVDAWFNRKSNNSKAHK